WIPKALGASAGTYVRYRADELLDIVALESHRAKAFIVGEDLGTVEDEVRRTLFQRKILSYKVMWFEDRHPSEYPEQALASVTTHDLPTIAGMWSGADFRAQERLGMHPAENSARRLRERFMRLVGVGEQAPSEEVALRAYETLARA